jgi:GNAT superfamily N-acetyltransferase
VPREVVTRAIANSLCFCVFGPDGQAGFARVITDRATFAYLCDMFVAPPYIGQGLGKALVATIIAHPDLQGLRRRLLGTHDAHTLYARYGFVPLARPQNFMEIRDPDVYRQAPETE